MADDEGWNGSIHYTFDMKEVNAGYANELRVPGGTGMHMRERPTAPPVLPKG